MFQIIVKNGFIVIADQALIALSNFLTTIFLCKFLPIQEYGLYAIGFTTMISLNSISYSFVYTPMSVLCQGVNDSIKIQKISTNFIIHVLISLLILIGILLALHINKNNIQIHFYEFCLYALCVFLYLIQEFLRMACLSNFNYRFLIFADVISVTARFAILLIVIKQISILYILISFVVSFSIIIILNVAKNNKIFKNITLIGKGDIVKVFLENFQYGKWLIGESLCYFFSNQFYIYLSAYYVNLQAVAALAACQTIANSVNFIMNGMCNYLVPVSSNIYYKNGFKKMANFVFKYSKNILLIIIIFLCVVVLSKNNILLIIYNEKYVKYSYLLNVIFFQVLFDLLSRPFIVIFRSSGMPNVGFKLKLLSFIIALIISFPLVRCFDVFGAAIGQMITYFVWFIMYTIFYFKYYRSEQFAEIV